MPELAANISDAYAYLWILGTSLADSKLFLAVQRVSCFKYILLGNCWLRHIGSLMIPALLYLMLQRYLVQGMAGSAVKG